MVVYNASAKKDMSKLDHKEEPCEGYCFKVEFSIQNVLINL